MGLVVLVVVVGVHYTGRGWMGMGLGEERWPWIGVAAELDRGLWGEGMEGGKLVWV